MRKDSVNHAQWDERAPVLQASVNPELFEYEMTQIILQLKGEFTPERISSSAPRLGYDEEQLQLNLHREIAYQQVRAAFSAPPVANLVLPKQFEFQAAVSPTLEGCSQTDVRIPLDPIKAAKVENISAVSPGKLSLPEVYEFSVGAPTVMHVLTQTNAFPIWHLSDIPLVQDTTGVIPLLSDPLEVVLDVQAPQIRKVVLPSPLSPFGISMQTQTPQVSKVTLPYTFSVSCDIPVPTTEIIDVAPIVQPFYQVCTSFAQPAPLESEWVSIPSTEIKLPDEVANDIQLHLLTISLPKVKAYVQQDLTASLEPIHIEGFVAIKLNIKELPTEFSVLPAGESLSPIKVIQNVQMPSSCGEAYVFDSQSAKMTIEIPNSFSADWAPVSAGVHVDIAGIKAPPKPMQPVRAQISVPDAAMAVVCPDLTISFAFSDDFNLPAVPQMPRIAVNSPPSIAPLELSPKKPAFVPPTPPAFFDVMQAWADLGGPEALAADGLLAVTYG